MLQFQTPIFSLNTKGAWMLCFDDILADALEQGPLMYYEVYIPEETRQAGEKLAGKKAAPLSLRSDCLLPCPPGGGLRLGCPPGGKF